MIGRTDWFDLPVADLADAMSFYEGLLGWTYRQMENSPISDYVMIDVSGKLIGGLRKVPKNSLTSRNDLSGPIIYFTVDILGPKVTRAKELGAEIIGQAVDLGKDRGRYQWIQDRAGNLIALWAPQ
jgi:predicted enzyme related to lactoylglutathione lyase